ncbi:MAG TPA: hypothetical protein VKD67_03535 [Acidimicrobiales bacterium]|nr:hypothetical protein [Acidimicrobiales bacterium]
MDGDASVVDRVYQVVAGLLVAFAAVTALTGARTWPTWFKFVRCR